MTTSTEVGKRAPDFKLPSTGGATWKLSDARGGPIVLYFYPRDATPGCTKEGEDFRDLHAKFRKAGAQVLGISNDSLESHEKFKAAKRLPFELLSDPDRAVCKLYDVIRMKSMYGRKFLGLERSTFLIDAGGTLRREWRKVKVAGHAAEVLEAVQAL
jgi:peroxiredoxin Q/BCP